MIYLMADWFFSSTFTEVIKVLLSIDSIIYWLIAQFFAFIIDVASSEFVMSDLINNIINRTYIVVGVFALFIMSYSLIKGMFDPDGAFKGKNSIGSIIKNLLIAIALVALMPTIFQYLFRFQSIIVNNNVIGAVVLGTDDSAMTFKVLEYDSDGNVKYENGQPVYKEQKVSIDNVGYENYIKVSANNVAFSAMNAFIYADNDEKPIDLSEKITPGTFLTPMGLYSGIPATLESIYRKSSGEEETTFATIRNNVIVSGNFLEMNTLAYHVATGGDYTNGEGAHVSYMFVVSTIAGIVMLVLTFTFAINLVIRMFNLFLLELVSPIASFSLIIPNSKIFNNWLKAVMKEYLDIFIRLFTFNLTILFFGNIQTIMSQAGTIASGFNLLNLLFVIGLLIFINEAPKLIKDIFGIKENKKLKDRLFTGAVASTIGGALGLAGGLAGSAIGATHALADKETKGLHKAWNTVKGVGSGVSTGQAAAKSKKFSDFTGAVGKGVTAADTNRKKGDLYFKQHGSSLGGVIAGKAHDAMGYVAGIDPDAQYKEFTDQRFHSKAKDIHSKIGDTVKKAKLTLKSDQTINGHTYSANTELDVAKFIDRRDGLEDRYRKALAGDVEGLVKIDDSATWSTKYITTLANDLKSKYVNVSNTNPAAYQAFTNLTDSYLKSYISGDEDAVRRSLGSLRVQAQSYGDPTISSAIEQFIKNVDKDTIDGQYETYRSKTNAQNDQIIDAQVESIYKQYTDAKKTAEGVINYVVNQKLQTPGEQTNLVADLINEIKNAPADDPYIANVQVEVGKDANGQAIYETVNLKDQDVIAKMEKDYGYFDKVVKGLKKRETEFEATDERFINARAKHNGSKKDN